MHRKMFSADLFSLFFNPNEFAFEVKQKQQQKQQQQKKQTKKKTQYYLTARQPLQNHTTRYLVICAFVRIVQ